MSRKGEEEGGEGGVDDSIFPSFSHKTGVEGDILPSR